MGLLLLAMLNRLEGPNANMGSDSDGTGFC